MERAREIYTVVHLTQISAVRGVAATGVWFVSVLSHSVLSTDCGSGCRSLAWIAMVLASGIVQKGRTAAVESGSEHMQHT